MEEIKSKSKDEPLTVLVDYFGKEISDTLEVCKYYEKLIKEKNLLIRLDTHGGRYIEGLDMEKSYNNYFSCYPTREIDGDYSWMPRASVGVSAAPLSVSAPQNFLSPNFINLKNENNLLIEIEDMVGNVTIYREILYFKN